MIRLPLLAGFVAAVLAAPVSGQDPAPDAAAVVLERVGGGWNSDFALDLVARARATRADSRSETGLGSYRSEAEGYVYFYIDRPEAEDRTLIRTDQLALEVMWKAPGLTRQRMVGRRNEESLPTTISYHLDHLSVVQDEFEDVIRLGDGDEVADVTHPVAPGAEATYDYRVADSLTLAYGGQDQVRVYELQVRPKRPDLPGFVGAVYVDRERAAIVRMAFSFTPSSYVDPYLDYIRISLDNALWMDEYWLPYRQEVEIRRELPQLDFLAGSVIRARFRVGGYEFGLPFPDSFFGGRLVVTAGSPEQLAAYEFERGLYDDVEEMGLGPSEELADVEAQLREIALRQAFSGLAPWRFHVGGFSDLLRWNRVEETAVGVGTTVRLPAALGEDPRLRLVGGWAFGPERAWARAETDLRISPRNRLDVTARFDELVDIGPVRGASRLVNSLAGFGDEDYLDPRVERSLGARWSRALGDLPLELHPPTLVLGAGVARQRSAELSADAMTLRSVRAIDDGTYGWAEVGLETGSPAKGLFTRTTARVGFGERRTWVGPRLHAAWRTPDIPGAWAHEVELDAGWTSRESPSQELFLLGGRETLPGHDYRTSGGDAFGLLRVRSGRPVWSPWISAHVLAALGWVDDLGDPSVPDDWAADDDVGDVRASLGVGVDLLWDVLRLDVARGVPAGEWAFVFSVRPDFHGWL
jgi:hypothetical protein